MNNFLKRASVLCIGMIAIAILFRASILSHFYLVSGEGSDPIIDTSIFEHWYNFFLGKAHWNTVAYFAPYSDTLGYNDGYFFYGIIYSFFRTLHFDPFLSRECLLYTLSLIGYLSFYALARYLKYSSFLSISCALIFLFSNSLQLHMTHIQLASLFFSPFVGLYLLKLTQALKSNSLLKGIQYGAISSLSLAVWLFTAFYMAWFFIFFSSLYLIIWLSFHWAEAKNYFQLKIILPTGGFFILFTLPFLLVYLPKLAESGGHSFGEALFYTPNLAALLNVGEHNLLFGKLYTDITHALHNRNDYEYMIGYSYLSFILLVIAIYLNIKKHRHLVLSLTILVSFMLMLQSHGCTLWKLVYHLFPGAKGLRVVARYAIFLNFPITLLLLDFFSRIKYRFLFIALPCLTIISNVNAVTTNIKRIEKMDLYNSFQPIPATCKLFFVIPRPYPYSANTVGQNVYDHNVDAMFLAEKFNVRTVNGFSTFNPPSWDFSSYPLNTYIERVYRYLIIHKIEEGICSLDLHTKQWETMPDKSLHALQLFFLIHPGYKNFYGIEYNATKTPYRWGQHAHSSVVFVNYTKLNYHFTYHAQLYRPQANSNLYVDLITSQGKSYRYQFTKPIIELTINTTIASGEQLTFHFSTNAKKITDTPMNNRHLYFQIINPIVTVK